MIISNSQKYVFIHINKSAGTSVTNALAEQLSWNDLALGLPPMTGKLEARYREKYGLYKHCTALEVRRVVGQQVWENFYKFSFVRNPYAKAVSAYTYVKRLVDSRGWHRYAKFARRAEDGFWEWPGAKAYLDTKDFSSFLRHPEALKANGLLPQSRWLCDEDGDLIIDFVGRLENLAADMAQISARLDLGEIKMGHHNKSGTDKWRAHSDCFAADFDRFGYEKMTV